MNVPPVLDPETEKAMRPLLDRGLASFRSFIMRLDARDRPIGITDNLTIVTEADFIAHAALCLRHVLMNGRTLYVLCKDDHQLCAVLAQRRH